MQQQVLQLCTGQLNQDAAEIAQLESLNLAAIPAQPMLQLREILQAKLGDSVGCCCCCFGPFTGHESAGEPLLEIHVSQ